MFGRQVNIALHSKKLCTKHGYVQFVLKKNTYSDDAKPKKLVTPPPKDWFKTLPPDQGSLPSLFARHIRPSVEYIKWAAEPIKFGMEDVQKWYQRTSESFEKDKQHFIVKRHETLGSNLAIAHFIVHRGGKVMLQGNTEWTQKDKNEEVTLPEKFDPSYIVTMIDASGMDLRYEGFENFCNLGSLKWISFKGCKYLDDWCLDRITALVTTAEYLDISNCKQITHKGLVALCKMLRLKKVIVTNFDKSNEFELTCLLLEESNPNLQCDILEPEDSSTSDNKNIEN